MKAVRIALFSSLIACTGGLYWTQQSIPVATLEAVPVALVEQPVIFQSLEETVSVAEPIVPPLEVVRGVETPVEVKTPVQPLEERGDAMLFEIEALAGTPFDQAILMPFD